MKPSPSTLRLHSTAQITMLWLRSLIPSLLTIVLCGSAFSTDSPIAPDLRPELQVSGRVDSIEVNPAGEIWFGTATGHVYASADWNRTWREVTVPVRQSGPATFYLYDSISQVRFFDSKRAIIAGYLGDSQNLIYRTVDGGSTWSTVKLPSGLWVYDARTTPSGLAWLVGSDGSLLFSEDYGASWTSLKAPFDPASRSHSVHFVSRSLGIVGSLDGSLKFTETGGRSWHVIKSPTDAKLATCDRARIECARILGEQLIVEECGGVYTRALRGKEPWRQLLANGHPITSFELSPEGLVAVDSNLEIVKIGPDLQVRQATGHHLEAYPLDIAVGAQRVAFLDSNLKVAILSDGQVTSSRMFGAGGDTKWPISARDRGADGAFWGISRFYLYTSHDVGRTWARQTELPQAVEGVAVQTSGDILLWNRHGYTVRWSLSTHDLVTVSGLDGLDIVGLFRRGSLWLAYGGMQYETTQRIEVARTYFSGQFAGSADHGFVAASTDGGETWRVVDEWKDEGIQALFLGEDNALTLVSWLGAVRRGRLILDKSGRPSTSMETILPVNKETWHQVPYVEQAHVLDFLGGSEVGLRDGPTTLGTPSFIPSMAAKPG